MTRFLSCLFLLCASPVLAQTPAAPIPNPMPHQGFLQTPGADTQRGYLPTPGSNAARGYLDTPGSTPAETATPRGYLATPGGGLNDTLGYLPTPGSVPVIVTRPGQGANLGPSSTPVWLNPNAGQRLYQDTRPRTDSGALVELGVFSPSTPDNALPNPNPVPPVPYSPTSLYDRTQPERPGGNVTYNGDPRAPSVHHDPSRRFVDRVDDHPSNRFAPGWVSELADNGETWIWGRPVVVDGDTFMLAGEQIRLAGIDAPELDQLCTRGSLSYACGRESQAFLAAHIEHQTVACALHYTDVAGRQIATCRASDFEINGTMIARGHALPWKGAPSPYDGMSQDAAQRYEGIWATTFSHPHDWRAFTYTAQRGQDAAIQQGQAPSRPAFPHIPFGQSPRGNPGSVYDATRWQ